MTEFFEIIFFVVVSLMLLILAVIPLLLRKLDKKRLFLPPSDIFTDAAYQYHPHTSTTPSRALDPGNFQFKKIEKKSCGTCTFLIDGYCGLHDLECRLFEGSCIDHEPHTHTRNS